MKTYFYKMEDMTWGNGYRVRYTFKDKTLKGEALTVDLSRCENSGRPNSLPNLWFSHGYIDKILTTWVGVNVFVTDDAGNCRRDYDPTLIFDPAPQINFDWIIEDTPENRSRIIAEICRRAFEEVSD